MTKIKLLYYIWLILTPVLFISIFYSYFNKDEIKKNKNEKINVDTLKKIDTARIQTDNILFITFDKVELKDDPNKSAETINYLNKNSIFYIIQKGSLGKIQVEKKNIEDFWYEIDDYKGNSGWVFGYYTSKSINKKNK